MDADNTYCFNCGTQIGYMGVIYGKNITGCVYCTEVCPKCGEYVFNDGWGFTDHLHEMDNATGCCKACIKKAEEETKLWEDDDDLDDDDDLGDDSNVYL